MKEAFFDFKGSSIRYHHRGQGKAVFFLHGFLESSEMWDSIVQKLPDSLDPICIDLPGHGQSDSLGYVHRMEDFAECCEALLKHLGKRKAALIGHSMGGYVALAFVDLYPDSVKGICLMNSTAKADSPQKKKDRLRAKELVKENHKSFIRLAIPGLFRYKHRRVFKEEVQAVKSLALNTSKKGVLAALEGMRLRPSREILLKFPAYPIHFIIGKKDPVIPFESYTSQLKLSNKIESVVLSQSGHMSHIEAEEECLEGILHFLRKT